MDKNNNHKKHSICFWKTPWIITGVLLLGYWLYTYHYEHVMGFLPFLIFLLCPLMHLFMHGKHGGCHNNKKDESKKEDEE